MLTGNLPNRNDVKFILLLFFSAVLQIGSVRKLYFNPGIDEARDYIVNGVKEITVTHYEINWMDVNKSGVTPTYYAIYRAASAELLDTNDATQIITLVKRENGNRQPTPILLLIGKRSFIFFLRNAEQCYCNES